MRRVWDRAAFRVAARHSATSPVARVCKSPFPVFLAHPALDYLVEIFQGARQRFVLRPGRLLCQLLEPCGEGRVVRDKDLHH